MRLLLLLLPGLLLAQPALPPVVLVNGYQTPPCATLESRNTFGELEARLRDAGRTVIWFNNCAVPAKSALRPTIEELGDALGEVIRSAGSPQVDIVAHSMGGLILRSYLAGKQNAPRTFLPPADPRVRKAVFVGTPHFGPGLVGLLSGAGGSDPQVQELLPGSRFLFDLATWNGGGDDLRGIDAVAIVGDRVTGSPGAGDGLVDVTSASLSFAVPATRQRFVPYCHVSELALLFPTCRATATIGGINSDDHLSWRIIRSFLTGTGEWMQLGASTDDALQSYGGLLLSYQDQNGAPAPFNGTVTAGAIELTKGSFGWYREFVPSGAQALTLPGSPSVNINAGRYNVAVVKPGPQLTAALPAAALLPIRSLAPGMFVSLYGSVLADTPSQAGALPLPDLLAGTRVTASGTPLGLQYAGPAQINLVLPEDTTGSFTLEVRTPRGAHQLPVFVEPAAPAIFTQPGTGAGAAAAIDGVTGALLTPQRPARTGDIVSLFLTGLGATEQRGALRWARIVPEVEIGGIRVTPQYAGRAPGYAGLDQINFAVPAGAPRGPAVALTVRSQGRVSNVTTLAVE